MLRIAFVTISAYLLQNVQVSKLLAACETNTNPFKFISARENVLEYVVEYYVSSLNAKEEECVKQGDLNETFFTNFSSNSTDGGGFWSDKWKVSRTGGFCRHGGILNTK